MAVRTREELFQRMNNLIRSGGQGGKTKASEVRALITDLIDTTFSLFSNSGTSGGILQYHPTTLYDFENTPFCEFNYRIFKTKIDGQMGNEPPFSPNENGDYENDYWIEVSPAPESGIAEWEAGVYTGDLVIVYYANKLYRLDVPENELPFESADIDAEIVAEKWVAISGGDGASTETSEFQSVNWSASINITVPEGIKAHKVVVNIPPSTPVGTATIGVIGSTNGTFINISIYNNDSVNRTVVLPTGDRAGNDLMHPIILPAGAVLDMSMKNDGNKRIWQATQTREIV